MKQPVFKGACTAIVTPFNEKGIDFETLDKQLRFQAQNGIQAIVAAGTTGENATLEIHEHNLLVDFCVRKCRGRMKVIVGVGGNNTAACMRKAKNAEESGADAVLMTPPYYNKTNQTGLIAHFLSVADSVSIPLILYNVPSRTVLGISAETYRELALHPNINGVKEASGNFSLIAKIAAECGDNLNIWSGNDDNTIPMMSIGAKGVISVLSNIAPAAVSDMCAECLNGDFSTAWEIWKNYAVLCETLFCDVNPIPVKAAMRMLETDSGMLRLPLTELSEPKLRMLENAMYNSGLIRDEV